MRLCGRLGRMSIYFNAYTAILLGLSIRLLIDRLVVRFHPRPPIKFSRLATPATFNFLLRELLTYVFPGAGF